jgi:hypothetical protein
MFGYTIATVFVAPLQYAAADRRLLFRPAVRVELEMEQGERPAAAPLNGASRERIEALLARLVLNPEMLPDCRPDRP